MDFKTGSIVKFNTGLTGKVTFVYDSSNSCDITLENGEVLRKVPFVALENGLYHFPSSGLYSVNYCDLEKKEFKGVFGFSYKIVKRFDAKQVWIIWNCGYNELVSEMQLRAISCPRLFTKYSGNYEPFIVYKGIEVKDFYYDTEKCVFKIKGNCTVCNKYYEITTDFSHEDFICNCEVGHDVFGLETECKRIGNSKFRITYEDKTHITLHRTDLGNKGKYRDLKRLPYVHKDLCYIKQNKIATYKYNGMDYIVDGMRFNPTKGVYEILVHNMYSKESRIIDLVRK